MQNRQNLKAVIYPVLLMLSLLAVASSVGMLFHRIGFPETNIVIVYIFAVLLAARFTKGYLYGVLAAVFATFTFNYLFTEPFFTFAVDDPSYLITFAVMTVAAILMSTITSQAKQNELESRDKEAESRALYRLTNHLTDALNFQEIAGIAVNTVSDILNCQAAFLCYDINGEPEQNFLQQASPGRQVRRKLDNPGALMHRMEGLRMGFDIGNEFYDWPVYGQDIVLGILRIPVERAVSLTDAQTRLLRSMIESIALAMDRLRSSEQRVAMHEQALQERYRGNLLRAISHDLRTPLSGIMGTAEILMDMSKQSDPRHGLAQGIRKDADWLHSLVENILSLTRLQEGKLTIKKQAEALEEIIGSAINHISVRSPAHMIAVRVPGEPLFVPMDAKLIEQVLINLLDNATKHTSAQEEISVCVYLEGVSDYVVVVVADRGEGIAEADLPNIFQMFYTSRAAHADAKKGMGLGLAICDAIIKAHGGSIEARNRTDGPGAEFRFTLPVGEACDANLS